MLRTKQYYKFCLYGFFKNLRFFDPFIILFLRDAGLSFLQIGLLYSIREITVQISEIPSGVFADSLGRKRAMLLSLLSYIVSFFIFYFFQSYTLFILAMIFFGIGEAYRSGTHKAMIMEYLKIHNMTDLRVAYYGNTRSWSQAGAAISSLGAAALVFYTGNYRIVFLASVVPYVIDLFLLASYPNELNFSAEKEHNKKQHILKEFRSIFIDTVQILKSWRSFNALLAASGMTAFFRTIKDYIQPILKQYVTFIPLFIAYGETERSAVLIGFVYFFIYVLTTIASRYSSAFSQRFSSVYKAMDTLLIFAAIVLTCIGLLFQIRLFIPVLLLYILFFVLQNLRKPMLVAYISDISSSKSMATVHSIEAQFEAVLKAILAPLLGFFVDWLGVGIGLAALGLMMLLLTPLSTVSRFNKQK